MRALFVFLLGLLLMSCKPEVHATSQTAEANVSSVTQDPAKAKVQEITPKNLEILREAGADVVILDVRTPQEVAEGKIPDAIEIDYQGENFEKQIDALGREKSYIVYCAGGGRSAKAAEMMAQKGFPNVFNLKGGYDAWIKTQK